MFKRNLKRFVAILMTAAMVIGSSAMAFAADPATGSLGGDAGEFEGWVNKKVFSVLVPTASANAFKMIIDPQGLIKATNAAAKEGLSANDFEQDATVLFPRSEPTQPKYGKTSDSISMANVGTVSVNYAVTAEVTGLDGKVTLSASENMAGIEDKAMLFMEMKKGTLPAGTFATDNGKRWDAAKAGGNATDDAIVLSSNKAVEVSANWIQGVKDEYKVSYNEADGYTYGISLNSVSAAKAAAYGDAFKVSFKGATNNGDIKAWKEAIGIKPVLTITYNITTLDADADEQEISGETGGSSAPSIEVKTYAINGTNDIKVSVKLGSGDKAATGIAKVVNNKTTPSVLESGTHYTFANNVLTFDGAFMSNIPNGRTFTVTFNDAESTSVTLTFTK